MPPPYYNSKPSSDVLPGSAYTWSELPFSAQESYEGQYFKGRTGVSQVAPLEENLTPDQPEDRIYRGWELKPHEFPWMVKLKVYLIIT